MPAHDIKKLREYYNSLKGIGKVLGDLTKQYPTDTIKGDVIFEYEKVLDQAKSDLPGLLTTFSKNDFFSHEVGHNQYYNPNGLKANIARNLGILKSQIDETSNKTRAMFKENNPPFVININKSQIHSGKGNNINKKGVTIDKNINKTGWWKKLEIIVSIFVVVITITSFFKGPLILDFIKKNKTNFSNKVERVDINPTKNANDSNSIKLDRSIFDLAKETVTTNLTSQERVNLISNISGLETKEESGKILDIGAGGLTLLISGNGDNGFFHIKCDFSLSWKQRISLLKKDSEIKFIGTVSKYDLSDQWIVLKDCRFLE